LKFTIMKTTIKTLLIIALVLLLSSNQNIAQNVGIGSASFTPDASAGLEVRYTDKGVLIPNVNIEDLSTAAPVTNPSVSLLVYNTNTTTGVGFYYWSGTEWKKLITEDDLASDGSSRFIGEQYGGGVIFHLWKDNAGIEHGLIVSIIDQSTSQAWSNITSTLIGSTAQSSWNGLSNSNAIVGQAGHTNSAAKLCLDLVSGDQSDWYLPSIDELFFLWNNRLYVNRTLSNIIGATVLPNSARYWSSTEDDASVVWGFHLGDGGANVNRYGKTSYRSVRAVRAF